MYKRTATRRARLVEHNGIYATVFDFEALYILPAYVYNEIYFRVEVQRRFVVRNRFNYSEIGLYGAFYQVFAVARYRTALYGYFSAAKGV